MAIERVCRVEVTARFEQALEAGESFLSQAGVRATFDELVNDLIETVIPNLERFPDMGREFNRHIAHSVEASDGARRIDKALSRFGPDAVAREYIFPPYLLLYSRSGQVISLLAIRHHRQLSFDFAGLWGV